MPLKDSLERRKYHAKYMREVWYPSNKKKHIGYVKKLKKSIQEYILEYKKKGRCVDCSFSGRTCPQVLEFDHVHGRVNKKFELGSWRASTLSIRKVQEEIKKCELVCANCHRIRTFSRLKKN